MSDRCQPTRATLNAYVDGELPPDDAAAIADHLTSCAHCSAEYQTVLDTIDEQIENGRKHSAGLGGPDER